MTDQALIDAFLAKGGTITAVDPGVSIGMKKTDYIARKPGGFGNRPAAEKLNTGDAKFDMYANALPSELRAWAGATNQDVRGLYKEYRALKKDGLLAKYLPVVQEWEKTDVQG